MQSITRVGKANLVNTRNAMLAMAASAGLASTAVGNARYTAWQLENPFTQTAWATHEGDSVRKPFDNYLFQDIGLNAGWDGRNSASSSHAHPNSIGFPTFMMSYQADPANASQRTAALNAAIADFNVASVYHTNLKGIILGDEVAQVFPTGGLAHQRNIRDWVVNNSNPAISSLMTISSNLGGDTVADDVNTQNHWNTTYNALLPDVWLSQHYPYVGSGLDTSYYRDLQWYNDWAKSKDVAMWLYPQAYGSSPTAAPSESELRHQRFTSLGYGVKGFADFMYVSNPLITTPGSAYYDPNTQGATTMGNQLKPINKEIANISKSLVALTHARTYHTDGEAGVYAFGASDLDLPVNLRRTGRLTGATSTNGNKLQVGVFKDVAGSEYFLMVNKNSAQASTGAALATDVTMNFDLTKFEAGRHAIRRLNRTTGVIETIPVTSGSHTFNLTGGTGDLFGYAGKPFMIQKTEKAPFTVFFDDYEQYTASSTPEGAPTLDSRYTYSANGIAASQGATNNAIVWESTNSGAGDSGSSSGSYGLGGHPNGGLWGVDHNFETGPITSGQLVIEGDLSLAIPLSDMGSSNHANLVISSNPANAAASTSIINFEAGSTGQIAVGASDLGGSIPSQIPLVTNSAGKNFHLKVELDLDAKTLVASISGDATGTTGVLNYTDDFDAGGFSLLAGRWWSGKTTWDNLKVVWTQPDDPVGDIDNNGSYQGHDIDLLYEAINATTNFEYYDVNGDAAVNTQDLNFLLGDVLDTTMGDTDLDGDVDLSDLANLAANYGGTMNVGWAKGNFDGDTDVDLNDLSTLATHYGGGQAEAFAAFQSLMAVPEPATAGLLALCGLAARRRRC